MALEILEFGFMQRALIAGVAVAITTSVIGLFLVLRRNSLFGDALSHVAFGGIAVGLAANVYPLWTGLALSILETQAEETLAATWAEISASSPP